MENDIDLDKLEIKNKKKNFGVWFFIAISILIIAAVLITQLLYDNGIIASNHFYENTRINGIDVTGMDKDEAANIIAAQLLQNKDDVSIKLKHKDKEWLLLGSDFENNNNIFPIIEQTFQKGRTGTLAEKIATVRNIKNNGLSTNITYRAVLGGFDDKIDSIIKEINTVPVEPSIIFNPKAKQDKMFTIKEGVEGLVVNKDLLYEKIDKALIDSKKIEVEIPVNVICCEKCGEELLYNTKLRSSFSTSYATSQSGRKNNVRLALEEFNGMVVEPGQIVSFNEITGEKTAEKGYKQAKIILNGVYVEGYGGGVCQSSTTLYNALILADLEILEAHSHSLPISYVPLALDAMVSEGYADLKFKNNLNYPIYIKCWGNDEKVYVEIYGEPLAENAEIRRRVEYIETLPHEGDIIIKDTKGEYADKITYLGEYFRLKYPQEGYHVKAYLGYYKNNKLVEEKLIRDEIYKPQKGIIMEGTAILGEGMELPTNDVKIIPPQVVPKTNKNNLNKKIEEQNPSRYNP